VRRQGCRGSEAQRARPGPARHGAARRQLGPCDGSQPSAARALHADLQHGSTISGFKTDARQRRQRNPLAADTPDGGRPEKPVSRWRLSPVDRGLGQEGGRPPWTVPRRDAHVLAEIVRLDRDHHCRGPGTASWRTRSSSWSAHCRAARRHHADARADVLQFSLPSTSRLLHPSSSRPRWNAAFRQHADDWRVRPRTRIPSNEATTLPQPERGPRRPGGGRPGLSSGLTTGSGRRWRPRGCP
jgi:hypothetical protein